MSINKNLKCTNCSFDTIAIVTVKTDEWSYCPDCGNNLVNILDDSETSNPESNDGMTEIKIQTESNENQEENSGEELNEDENIGNETEVGYTDDNQDSLDIENELDRLRDRFSSDD